MAVDKELLEGISLMTQGKEEGFNLLYSHTYNFVYARARAATKTEADAQDLTQETFLQAYKGIASLEDANNVYAWLGGIVYRQGAKFYNKTKKELLLNEDQDYIFDEVEATDLASLPEESAQLKATSDVVMNMIEELPEAQRSAILSFYYDHMKIEEIANAFDCSVNTIKSRLNYAKKFLKSKIEEHQARYSYKLYSLTPGILYFALRGLLGSDKYTMAPDTAEKVYRVACESLGFTASAVTAGTAATAAASTASSEAVTVAATAGTQSLASVSTATATVAKSTGIFAKFAAFSAAKKVATVAITVSLLGGGATTAVLLNNQTPTPPAVTAPAETATPVPTPPAPTAEATPTVTVAVVEEPLPTEAPTPTLTPTPWPIYFRELSFTPFSRERYDIYASNYDMDYYYLDNFSVPASTAEDENFRYGIFSGYASVCYKGGLGTKVEFPSEYNGVPIRAIFKSWSESPENTFINEAIAQVEEVIIPDTVWCLGNNCFEKFTALKKVTLSDTLLTINTYAFTECASLQELDIPKSVRFIGNQFISHCPGVQNVYVHSEDIETYGSAFAFSPITEATYIPLEDSAPTIDDITPEPEIPAEVPDSVDNPDWSFIDGTLTIKSGMQMVDYTEEYSPWIAYRDRIEVLIIEDGVSHIGNYAFFFCDYLKEVYIPGSVKDIGGYAFAFCRRIEKLELGEGVEVIGNAAFCETLSLTEVILPSTLKRIQLQSFERAQRLTNITFPEGLESISYSAFLYTPEATSKKAYELYKQLGDN